MPTSARGNKFSIEQVKKIQKRLEGKLEGVECVVGVGIGFDKKKHRPRLKVMVNSEDEIGDLPHTIDQLDVQYELVDEIKAL